MRMWSSGLGSEDTALVLDFMKADFKREGDKVYITGTVLEPVNWEFKLTIDKEDLPGILHVISTVPTCLYVLRNLVPNLFRLIFPKGAKVSEKA
jgi:hypothetical protein